MMGRTLLGLVVFAALVKPVAADTPLLAGSSLDALAGTFRGVLIQNVPTVLFQDQKNWGKTREVSNGITWHGLRPEVQKKQKNHGQWQKVTVWALNLPQTLVFDMRNLNQGQDTATFDAYLSFDARGEIERQNWRSGVRIASNSLKARFRVRLTMRCEISSRLDQEGSSLVPDVLFRLRVVNAHLEYDNLVFEHVAGMGGEMAHLLGKGLQGGLRIFHPSLEQELLAKGSRAIVKTADTKEVRISLSKLMGN
ncbi:MAG: hypothetical protein AB7K24_15545 [Gemmataceae bacterium]